jgi:competence protein ComFC
LIFLKQILYEGVRAGLDFIIPQHCVICNQEIKTGLLCNNCYDYIPLVKPPLCQSCGRPVKKDEFCQFCKNASLIDRGRAWMLFTPPVDTIIHHFKYRKKSNLCVILGRAMATIIKSDHFLKTADLIIPVPLYWWKLLRRGYNQAGLLAEIISENCGTKISNIMRRIKNTKTQTKLNEGERRKNVYGAFALKSNNVKGKKVILIDDVMTTGATINECARVLKEADAKEVYSCVAAITPG